MVTGELTVIEWRSRGDPPEAPRVQVTIMKSRRLPKSHHSGGHNCGAHGFPHRTKRGSVGQDPLLTVWPSLLFPAVTPANRSTMPGGAHENMKAWDPEEDDIILTMHSQIGPKWKEIVQRLPGRTVRR